MSLNGLGIIGALSLGKDSAEKLLARMIETGAIWPVSVIMGMLIVGGFAFDSWRSMHLRFDAIEAVIKEERDAAQHARIAAAVEVATMRHRVARVEETLADRAPLAQEVIILRAAIPDIKREIEFLRADVRRLLERGAIP